MPEILRHAGQRLQLPRRGLDVLGHAWRADRHAFGQVQYCLPARIQGNVRLLRQAAESAEIELGLGHEVVAHVGHEAVPDPIGDEIQELPQLPAHRGMRLVVHVQHLVQRVYALVVGVDGILPRRRPGARAVDRLLGHPCLG